jgi:hypothetical protein
VIACNADELPPLNSGLSRISTRSVSLVRNLSRDLRVRRETRTAIRARTGDGKKYMIFTAANGDPLTAFCAGFPMMQPDGTVVGGLDCNITGGTGRFESASGSYRAPTSPLRTHTRS